MEPCLPWREPRQQVSRESSSLPVWLPSNAQLMRISRPMESGQRSTGPTLTDQMDYIPILSLKRSLKEPPGSSSMICLLIRKLNWPPFVLALSLDQPSRLRSSLLGTSLPRLCVVSRTPCLSQPLVSLMCVTWREPTCFASLCQRLRDTDSSRRMDLTGRSKSPRSSPRNTPLKDGQS